jgi:leucine dehydrogenase
LSFAGNASSGRIRACVARRLGKNSLARCASECRGLGHVGERLARLLAGERARLLVTDIDAGRARRIARDLDADLCALDEVFAADVEVLAPCALGAVLDDRSISIEVLRAPIVAGAANNQLALARRGRLLHERGVLYAPDFVVNAGGMIQLAGERLGWSEEDVMRRVVGIGAASQKCSTQPRLWASRPPRRPSG